MKWTRNLEDILSTNHKSLELIIPFHSRLSRIVRRLALISKKKNFILMSQNTSCQKKVNNCNEVNDQEKNCYWLVWSSFQKEVTPMCFPNLIY